MIDGKLVRGIKKWKATDGDWINDEDGYPVVEYAGCGSHEASWTNYSDLQLALAAPELLEALRELHDFAETSSHHRHAERSRVAFDKAAELLKRLNG